MDTFESISDKIKRLESYSATTMLSQLANAEECQGWGKNSSKFLRVELKHPKNLFSRGNGKFVKFPNKRGIPTIRRCGILRGRTSPKYLIAEDSSLGQIANPEGCQTRRKNSSQFLRAKLKDPTDNFYPWKSAKFVKFVLKPGISTVYCYGIFRGPRNIPRRASLRENRGTLSGFNGQRPSRRKFQRSLLRSPAGTDVQDTRPRNILSAEHHLDHLRRGKVESENSESSWSRGSYDESERLRGGGSRMRILENSRENVDCKYNPEMSVLPGERGKPRKKVSMESLKNCVGQPQDRGKAERARVLRFDEDCRDREVSLNGNEDPRRIRGGYGPGCGVPQPPPRSCCDVEPVKQKRCHACETMRRQPSAHRLSFCEPPSSSSCRPHQTLRHRPSARNVRACPPQPCLPPPCSHQQSQNHSAECHPSSWTSSCPGRPCSPALYIPSSCSSPSRYLPLLHLSSSAPPPLSTESPSMPTYHSFSFHPPSCRARTRSPAPCSPPPCLPPPCSPPPCSPPPCSLLPCSPPPCSPPPCSPPPCSPPPCLPPPCSPSTPSCQRQGLRFERNNGGSKECCPCSGCGGAACNDNSGGIRLVRGCCGGNIQTDLPCKCKCQTCEDFHPIGGCGGQSCGRIYSCAGSGGGTCCFPRNTRRRAGPGCCGGRNRDGGGCC